MIVIVYGPQGCGKTRNRERLQARFKYRHLIDRLHPIARSTKFWDDAGTFYTELPDDSLCLTNLPATKCVQYLQQYPSILAEVIPFEKAMELLQ